jgi:hypothetical protein
MKSPIRHGNVIIGHIHHDLPMLGDEVIAETAFPASTPDDADQCSTFELGEKRLIMIYEDHLEAQKLLPAAPPVVAAPSDSDPDFDDIPF